MFLTGILKRWLRYEIWRYAAQGPDYAWLLPLLARLPLALAYRLSDLRGAFHARHARDWAELSIGFPYIGVRSAAAFREIFPTATETEIQQLVVQRYQTVAREEFEGLLAIRGRLDEIAMDLAPIRTALAKRQPGRGLVVVMSHFDNLFFGLIGMVRCGEAPFLMTSDIVQDARVHPTLRQFFKVKYQRYQEQLGGGEFWPTGAMARQTFYGVLNRGGIVVVVSEAPATGSKGTWVNWMGKRRKMADGALRMALDTDSQIIGMRNQEVKPGHVEWQWSALVDPREIQHHDEEMAREQIYALIFSFLEDGIKAAPGRWWAAHLLSDFLVQDDSLGCRE
jgi:lauroyl/myristoyl acyltransferase